MALLAQHLCTQCVDPEGLSAFTACRLIALDKCPGVRPIGVAEVAQRILGKAILTVIGYDIQQVVETIQLCAGQETESEAAIHAIRQIFNEDEVEEVLLVDTSSALNQLNRELALQNVQVPYSSKFSWYNIFVIFVINLSFTKIFFTKITMGVAFFTCVRASVASYLLTTKKQVLRKTN